MGIDSRWHGSSRLRTQDSDHFYIPTNLLPTHCRLLGCRLGMASSITLPDFEFPTIEDEDYDEEGYEDAEGEEYDEAEDLEVGSKGVVI